MSDYSEIFKVGSKVFKSRRVKMEHGEREPKPFASGHKINTVKELTINPHTNLPACKFIEDDAIVDCKKLVIATPEQIENEEATGKLYPERIYS